MQAAVLTAVCLNPFAPPARAGGTAGILFVSSHTSTPYLQFVDTTKQSLRNDGLSRLAVTERSASQLIENTDAANDQAYDMVVALGTQAAQALQHRHPHVPVLYALIPEATYHNLRTSGRLACPGGQCTAIYIDQPLPRLLDVLEAAFAGHRRPGVLFGPTSAHNADRLETLSKQRGLSLQTARVGKQDELLTELNDLLKRSDVLLSLPDPVVYNRQTAKSVLLTTYRYKVPVLAYSKAYADSGAALSVYSTPAQIARQAAGIISAFMQHGKRALPSPQYPRYYKIRINRHVADSLGLNLESNPGFQALMTGTDDEQTEYTE